MHIIGGAGSGKTTLARTLGCRLDLPAIDLDHIAWGPQGQVPLAGRQTAVAGIVARGAWIAEGVYLWWVDPLLQAADVIVWLDLPFRLAAWRIVRRHALASWRGDNPHAGLGRLWRFLGGVRQWHVRPAPVAPAPDDDFALSRAATLDALRPYQAKVIACRRPRDVRHLLRRFDS